MFGLTPRQTSFAALAGAGLYVVLMGGVGAWLFFHAEATVQRRIAATPSVTVSLLDKPELSPEKKTDIPKVPSSWVDDTAQQQSDKKAAEKQMESVPQENQATDEKIIPAEDLTATSDQEADKPPPPTAETPALDRAAIEKKQAVVPPVIPDNANGRVTWQRFARPFDQKDARPRIALIVSDLGLATGATQAAIQDLPGEITLAFSSLGSDIESNIAKARAAGHEVLLSVPMEPQNYPLNDPGPNTLLTALPDKDNTSRLRWALARAEGYVGIIPSMGEKFVTDEKKLTPVMDVIKDETLMIIDNTNSKDSLIAPLSRLGKIPFARSDLLIDASAARNAIDTQLAELEKIAKERGQAVGLAMPYPVTFEKLKEWISTLEAKGLVLAPITAVASEEIPVVTPVQSP